MSDLERRLGRLEVLSGHKEGVFGIIYAPGKENEAEQEAECQRRIEAYYRDIPEKAYLRDNPDNFFLVIITPNTIEKETTEQ